MAYVSYQPNEPQEHAQPVHGSGARVQDHDPETNQPVSRKAVEQVTTSQQVSQEMLENATLVTPFGKEDTAAESQSHAARTQDTLVNAVENTDVTEIIRAVFSALTRLRAAETKEFDTIARLGTQITNENNETFRRETVSHDFKTAPVAGAHDEEERQRCQEYWCDERSSASR